MTETIARLAATSTASGMLARLALLDEKARRREAGEVRDLFRDWYGAYLSFGSKKAATPLKDEDALKIAMLATATQAELRPYSFHVLPRSIPIVEVMRALAPSWIDDWVEHLVESNPATARDLAHLWRAGLCRRPESDAVILAYYNPYRGADLAKHPEFLDDHVWRFFEVEGGGDLSLASHDKYCQPSVSWTNCLLDLARTDQLDRARLLDASLDALERDFGQFRAGWYSRFHAALEPTPQEQAERADRYLHLLGSNVPPTVALALKALATLDKAGKVPLDDLLIAIPPALLSRQKSSATAALRLLASAGKKAPARAAGIAGAALTALVSEAADVQDAVLDLVGRLGAVDRPEVQAVLAEHLDLVAPSVRKRLSGMIREAGKTVAAEAPEPQPEPAVAGFAPIAPVTSPDEALAAFLAVLEDPRDPLAVERAMDGVSRFGAAWPPDSSRLSPLAKRAGQVFDAAGYHQIRLALAACGRAWCGAGVPGELVREAAGRGIRIAQDSLAATFLERCDEIVARIRRGVSLPLLSLPSDTSGQVRPADLVDRLESWRAAGAVPGTVDLALALTRLGCEGRDVQRERLDRRDETGQAVAFALGAGTIAAGSGPVWAAAWLARTDPARKSGEWGPGEPEPDAGVAARYELRVEKRVSSGYSWCQPAVEIVPALRQPDGRMPASLLHHRVKHFWGAGGHACGSVPADIAWASLVRPACPEAFLANAINDMDPAQKLADHPCIAYLDAFDRLEGEPGPIACAVLAFYLVSEDKALCAHTVDRIARLAAEGRLPADRFADAILPFMLVGTFPSMRWTRNLAAAAGIGPRHRRFVRDVVAGLMRFQPDQAPRDVGGMIELLYELQLACGAPFDDEAAIACLERLESGGKAAKFAGKLLALRSDAGLEVSRAA